jgi:hypothetical protein
VLAAETEFQAVARAKAADADPCVVPAAERETPIVAKPRTPLSPRARRRRWIVATVVVVGLAAAIVALVRAHRPNDGWTREEDTYAAFLDSAALSRRDAPAAFDPDSAIAAFGRDEPDALRGAAAAHVQFAPPPQADVHQVFDAFLRRFVATAPRWSYHLGVHPHPASLPRPDAAKDAAVLLLLRDLWHALHDRTDADRMTPHERADRAALFGWADFALRRGVVPDVDALAAMKQCADPLLRLAEIRCCPETDRCDAASAVLESIPEVLSECSARLKQPPYSLVEATARELDDVAAWLPSYGHSFASAAPASRSRMALAAVTAIAALTEASKQLRGNPHRRVASTIGIGAGNADLVLRIYHHLPFGARDVYERALDELRDAHDDMRRLLKDARESPEALDRGSDESQIRDLREACADWVPLMPKDAGLAVRPTPAPYEHRTASAMYLDPGAMAPADAGIVFIGPAPEARFGFSGNYTACVRRHSLAHETYPGHRMDHVFRRSACALRQFVDDRVFVEGWAVYAAEDVLHETRHCSLGPVDDYVRACVRADRAAHAMNSILIETGAADSANIRMLLSMRRGSLVSEADIGEHECPTLYSVDYFVGVDEIRRLRLAEEERLGSAFDLKAFHAKLLSEGPIPPRLIEEEWRESAH